MTKKKALISWSTGKDSALAMYKVLESQRFEVVGLLTCITSDYNRVSIHGIHIDLLAVQAELLDLPIYPIFIPADCSMLQYQERLQNTLQQVKQQGIDTIIFGDIFLENVRNFRLRELAKLVMKADFPLWGMSTSDLSREMISLGFKSLVTCVDKAFLAEEFTARKYDEKFLSDLPAEVDPCGENGEFHTFVYAGPFFKKDIEVKVQATILRGQSSYADIQLA